MKKVLKYKRLQSNSKDVFVQITEQSHRGLEFGDGTNCFQIDAETHLRSLDYPEYTLKNIYVRGRNTNTDSYVIVFPKEKFQLFEQAVREYNNHDFPDIIPLETIEKVHKNIAKKIEDDVQIIQTMLMQSTKSTNDLMDWKKRLMSIIVDMIPIGTKECVYCVHHGFFHDMSICNICTYGKKKGKCTSDGSNYNKIREAIRLLKYHINNY